MSWSLVLLVLLGLAPSPAEGIPDPREVVQLPLDVANGTATRRGQAIVFTLYTYAPFTNADLQQADGEDYAVAIGISTYGVCTKDEKVPEADRNVFSPREDFAGFATVTRPSEDSVEVTIPVHVAGPRGLGRFRWQARMVSSPESGSVHYDYVPDDGPVWGGGS